jgi:hypothetical protein
MILCHLGLKPAGVNIPAPTSLPTADTGSDMPLAAGEDKSAEQDAPADRRQPPDTSLVPEEHIVLETQGSCLQQRHTTLAPENNEMAVDQQFLGSHSQTMPLKVKLLGPRPPPHVPSDTSLGKRPQPRNPSLDHEDKDMDVDDDSQGPRLRSWRLLLMPGQKGDKPDKVLGKRKEAPPIDVSSQRKVRGTRRHTICLRV